ncbi:hypothetical protein [Streptomyces omiyaensis]|uniref:DUF4034 domain-containing protein n=1 Tax=Streptomyces omiyaensis TaxID=68247 RepID=A0ABW7C319_9ACTN|nr:hypothetical protein [Streptomyces omiyaensis]GGY81149.1 hypothetical protein GCM10010363_72450 [Streptomyces omiyaensis]
MALLRELGNTLGRLTGRPVARVDEDAGDPEAGRVREAAAARDWAAVRDVLDARPESEDRTGLLWAVGDVAGVEGWIADVVAAEPEAPLPRLVAGVRHISWAWEARTSASARHVSREQFQVFHERLAEAETWLYEVAEREPGWTSPWYALQVTGRGLEVGPDVARRRFEATVRRDPHHLGAHQQRLQQLCRKWGGSHEEMHDFAHRSAFDAPGGTLLGQLVAVAHIEHWLHLDSGADARYIGQPQVIASLHRAADHSVRHRDFVPGRGSLQVLNTFAMAFSLAGDHTAAREFFLATEGRVTEFPWYYLDGDPVASYKARRALAGR